jgi:uncharacterized membrane protein
MTLPAITVVATDLRWMHSNCRYDMNEYDKNSDVSDVHDSKWSQYRILDSIVIDVIGTYTFGYYLSVFTNVPPPPKPHM